MTNEQKTPLPDYGELMTLQEFAECVRNGFITPDDGSGYFATETEMFRKTNCFDFSSRPKDATNVIWFNK